jgi:hypothetical protein
MAFIRRRSRIYSPSNRRISHRSMPPPAGERTAIKTHGRLPWQRQPVSPSSSDAHDINYTVFFRRQSLVLATAAAAAERSFITYFQERLVPAWEHHNVRQHTFAFFSTFRSFASSNSVRSLSFLCAPVRFRHIIRLNNRLM